MSLKSLIRNQKPLTVSLISFLLMLILVIIIGLVGGRHIIGYLQQQLVAHGISHNQEVLAGIQPMLERSLQDGTPVERIVQNFQQFIEHAEPFGVRLFLIDRQKRQVIADSARKQLLPYAIEQLMTGPVKQLDGTAIPDLSLWNGVAWRGADDGSIDLLSLHRLSAPAVDSRQWTLGVSSDLSELLVLMDELHLHLDVVLLITYGLIGLLGFLVLRWVGRRYEFSLEKQVAERTEALQQAHERLLEQARLATIGQTASVLAHEMRNPLASIKLALSGVSRSERLSGREKQRVELVVGEVDRLEAMLNQTLDYVRPVVLDDQPVVLDELLDKVLALEEGLLAEKSLRLVRNRCPGCPKIFLDSEKMRQVILNLLKNAREASPDESEIQVSLTKLKGQLLLEISNWGAPMDADMRARAFDFFFTTKARGTGLGLGLVKRVVEEHGGHVKMSNEGDLIKVSIVLPVS